MAEPQTAAAKSHEMEEDLYFVASKEDRIGRYGAGRAWSGYDNEIPAEKAFQRLIRGTLYQVDRASGLVYASNDEGESWTKKCKLPDQRYRMEMFPYSYESLEVICLLITRYTSTGLLDEVFWSRDGLESVELMKAGKAFDIGGPSEAELVMTPSGAIFAYCYGGAHVSADGGLSWERFDLTVESLSRFDYAFNSIVTLGSVMYAGVKMLRPNRGVNWILATSKDEGRTWEEARHSIYSHRLLADEKCGRLLGHSVHGFCELSRSESGNEPFMCPSKQEILKKLFQKEYLNQTLPLHVLPNGNIIIRNQSINGGRMRIPCAVSYPDFERSKADKGLVAEWLASTCIPDEVFQLQIAPFIFL
jgi:hypothetical protein